MLELLVWQERIDPFLQAKDKMPMDTFFGYFAQAAFTAFCTTLAQQQKTALSLERIQVYQATAFSLRRSGFERMFAPILVAGSKIHTLYAMTNRDVEVLKSFCSAGVGLHQALEQAFSAAVIPFEFVAKQRALFQHLEASPNAIGFTAHHLNGALTYTAAQAWIAPPHGAPFSVCLLVDASTCAFIEERSTQPQTLRALKAIVNGAYVCQPQSSVTKAQDSWAAENLAKGQTLSLSWLHSLFCANAGGALLKLLRRTAVVRCKPLDKTELDDDLWPADDKTQALTAVRLGLEGHAATMMVFFGASQAKALLQLSKSGSTTFLGGFLCTLFGEGAKAYSHLSGVALKWKLVGVGSLETPKAMQWLSNEGTRGMFVKQTLRLESGTVFWLMAIPPLLLQQLLRFGTEVLKGKAKLGLPKLGLHQGHPPLQALLAATPPQHALMTMRVLLRVLENTLKPPPLHPKPALSSKVGAPRQPAKHRRGAHQAPPQTLVECLATAMAETQGAAQNCLLEALPVHLRERVENTPGEPAQKAKHLRQLANALATVWLQTQIEADFPHNPLSAWGALYAEALWALREEMLEGILPLRMLIFSMQRQSLTQWLMALPTQPLVSALCGVSFSLLDQVRRASSTAFAIRLLEEIGSVQQKTNAFQAQQGQITLFQLGAEHLAEGRLLLRPSAVQGLKTLVEALQEWQ